jgi:hypothetical protein
MAKITLTRPLADNLEALRNGTREARGLLDPELLAILDLEERAIRMEFGVYGTDADVDEALSAALIAGFSSFRKQLKQTRKETIGSSSYSFEAGEIGWPRAVGLILADVVDPAIASGATTTELQRSDDHSRGVRRSPWAAQYRG